MNDCQLEEVLKILDERAAMQYKILMKTAARILPPGKAFVEDDLLQPQDFPELEYSAEFRYEEGILHGIWAARAFLLTNYACSLTKN